MRANSADRSFALVLVVGLSPYVVLFLAGCGLATSLGDEIADQGLGELVDPRLLPMTFVVALLAIGMVRAGWSVSRQIRATRELTRHVHERSVPRPPSTPPDVSVVTDHPEPFALTFGFGTPRVVVSRGLLERLSSSELDAVLTHERYHVRSRDPLKLVVGRAVAQASFFLPASARLVDRYVAGRELAADRRSLRAERPGALAGALVKVTAGPTWPELGGAAAMASPELLALRVDQLEHGREPDLLPVPPVVVAVSGVLLATITGVIALEGLRGGLAMAGTDSVDVGLGEVTAAVAGGLVCGVAWVCAAAFVARRLMPRA